MRERGLGFGMGKEDVRCGETRTWKFPLRPEEGGDRCHAEEHGLRPLGGRLATSSGLPFDLDTLGIGLETRLEQSEVEAKKWVRFPR